jgi:tetratricopeptide (TPR) repeat protein
MDLQFVQIFYLGRSDSLGKKINNSIQVILIIACSILFSCATTQQTQLNSRDADVYINRGLAYCQKGQYDQAISDLSKAIEINPRLPHAYNNRGWAYIKKLQYDQALSDFNKTIKIDPRFAEAYFNRAVVYFLKKKYDKSLVDVMMAQQLGYQIPPQFLDDLRKAAGGTGV